MKALHCKSVFVWCFEPQQGISLSQHFWKNCCHKITRLLCVEHCITMVDNPACDRKFLGLKKKTDRLPWTRASRLFSLVPPGKWAFYWVLTWCSTSHFVTYTKIPVGRDSAVGIATRYGLDDQGLESRWGRDFPHRSRPAPGRTQPPIQRVWGLSRG
jgi:hypothetical protein